MDLLWDYDLKNKFLSLTRWDVLPNSILQPARPWGENDPIAYGADTWIFKTPIQNIDTKNIQIGTWGCDGGLIQCAIEHNLKVLNPCKDIRCCHLHQSGIKHYPYINPNFVTSFVKAGSLRDISAKNRLYNLDPNSWTDSVPQHSE